MGFAVWLRHKAPGDDEHCTRQIKTTVPGKVGSAGPFAVVVLSMHNWLL